MPNVGFLNRTVPSLGENDLNMYNKHGKVIKGSVDMASCGKAADDIECTMNLCLNARMAKFLIEAEDRLRADQ